MISIIIAAILGIVQGFTEVFPISSSLHCYVVIEFLNQLLIKQTTVHRCLVDFISITEISDVYKNGMDVVLHVGSLLAILIFFRNDVIRIICEFLRFLKYSAKSLMKSQITVQMKSQMSDLMQPQTEMNFMHVIIFTLPICFVTLCSHFVFFYYSLYAGVFSIFSAIVLYLVNEYATTFELHGQQHAKHEQYRQREKNTQNRCELTLRCCFIVGFIQSFAIFPGMSRFGLCLIGFRLLKFSLNYAVRYSLMFSMPIIFGSMLFKIKYILSISVLEIATGVFFSFLFTYISLPLAVKLLSKNSFMIFVTLYRIVLGMGILCFM